MGSRRRASSMSGCVTAVRTVIMDGTKTAAVSTLARVHTHTHTHFHTRRRVCFNFNDERSVG